SIIAVEQVLLWLMANTREFPRRGVDGDHPSPSPDRVRSGRPPSRPAASFCLDSTNRKIMGGLTRPRPAQSHLYYRRTHRATHRKKPLASWCWVYCFKAQGRRRTGASASGRHILITPH